MDHDHAHLRESLSIQRLILHMANQRTKFEVPILSHSRDILLLLIQLFYGSLDFVQDYPVCQYQKGKTRKVKPTWIYCSKR